MQAASVSPDLEQSSRVLISLVHDRACLLQMTGPALHRLNEMIQRRQDEVVHLGIELRRTLANPPASGKVFLRRPDSLQELGQIPVLIPEGSDDLLDLVEVAANLGAGHIRSSRRTHGSKATKAMMVPSRAVLAAGLVNTVSMSAEFGLTALKM
jgi:hypothetical protein